MLIPIQCEYYALEGLEQLLRTVDLVRSHLNPGLVISTILLTMYDGRTRLASQVADEVRATSATWCCTVIPRSVRVSEAPSYGQSVMTYDPGVERRASPTWRRPGRWRFAPEAARQHRLGRPRGGISLWERAAGAAEASARGTRETRRAAMAQKRGWQGYGDCRPAAGRTAAAKASGQGEPQRRTAAGSPAGGGRRRLLRGIPDRAVTPNPRQPRRVFDEEALDELADSIKAGRPAAAGRGPRGRARPVRAGHGRTPLAGMRSAPG